MTVTPPRLVAAVLTAMLPLLAASPAHAGPPPVSGGGVLAGSIAYSNGGIPVPFSPCRLASVWSFQDAVGVLALTDSSHSFTGGITLRGTGSDGFCSSTDEEFGSMSSLSLEGSSSVTGNTFDCDHGPAAPTGSFMRIGTHLHVAFQSYCAIDGGAYIQRVMAVEIDLVPSTGPDATGALTTFTFSGEVAAQTE